MAPPGSKHGQDPEVKMERVSQLKYNLEEKMKREGLAWDLKPIIIQTKIIRSINLVF